MQKAVIKAKCGSHTAKRLSAKAQGCRVSRLPWDQVVDAGPTPTGSGLLSKLNIPVTRPRRTVFPKSLDERDGRNPVGVAAAFTIRSQGSRATRQPWAVLLNRFAVPDFNLSGTSFQLEQELGVSWIRFPELRTTSLDEPKFEISKRSL